MDVMILDFKLSISLYIGIDFFKHLPFSKIVKAFSHLSAQPQLQSLFLELPSMLMGAAIVWKYSYTYQS